MKRYIYTTLLVFATLFCQASGVQNETLKLLDTVICVKPGATVHMSDFKPRILELLQNREDSIWSGCCDVVSMELEGNPLISVGGEIYTVWKDWIIDKNTKIGLTVNYRRTLTCFKIPLQKEPGMSEASLAMWYFFGRLFSETESEAVTKVADTAYVTTLHKATFVYNFQLALPEDSLAKLIKDDGGCFEKNTSMVLGVEDKYKSYRIRWTMPKGITNYLADTVSPIVIRDNANDYLYSIVCMATACKGETRFDTIFIGNPTPLPRMEDINCIASSENSFVAKVKDADSRLSYHWVFEESGGNRIPQSQQGDSVRFDITPDVPGRLWLTSTGGCRASDTVSRELHRSVMAGDIRLDGDTNCLFGGDSLSLGLQNAPQEHLVWRSKAGADTLLWNAGFVYRTNRTDTGILAVSVFSKYCPEDTAVATFNIRKDLAVSIDPNESCISAYTAQTFKAIGNGINLEVHWYGNGVELDTMGYPTKDSVLLRLINPGGNNLYVAVKAKECGRESVCDTLVLRPKPEKPSFDTLWGTLTPCIPLGMADTIELRVQPQEGVKFTWLWSESSNKFDSIGQSDGNSIRVRVNYELSDRDTIPVSVYAYTEGCPNSDTLPDTLYATGVGLEKKWNLIQQNFMDMLYVVGFSDNDVLVDDGFIDPFSGMYSFDWHSDDVYIENPSNHNYIGFIEDNLPVPFNLFCKLTSVEKQCYSVYPIMVVDMLESQNILSNTKNGLGRNDMNESEVSHTRKSFEEENMPCPSLALHPNPVRSGEQVRLEGICETESFTVECYSQQGRCLFRTSAKGDTFTIPTGSYAAGVYIIRIQPDGAATPIIKKLIII